MEWSIQQLARATGTTSRALRHYDHVGLLPPSRLGSNGYRFYDGHALVRLQRILLLRELGLGLTEIGRVLDRRTDEVSALTAHLELLRMEQDRLARQVRAVEHSLTALEKGEDIMVEHAFDGFDHTQYREEVERRWGAPAYADGDRWWRGMSPQEKQEWTRRSTELGSAWAEAAARGVDPACDEAQEIAARQVAWLGSIPGTPGHGGPPDLGYVRGLGELYVADDRFAAHYGGEQGARFVRDSLTEWADRHEHA